mmetsp:Transcript_8644/g.16303  ORF Transcript_8644/g.16303 Transcript_8644/m.16303 type:complete len:279 (-) Transcript_8644:494-1330(-)
MTLHLCELLRQNSVLVLGAESLFLRLVALVGARFQLLRQLRVLLLQVPQLLLQIRVHLLGQGSTCSQRVPLVRHRGQLGQRLVALPSARLHLLRHGGVLLPQLLKLGLQLRDLVLGESRCRRSTTRLRKLPPQLRAGLRRVQACLRQLLGQVVALRREVVALAVASLQLRRKLPRHVLGHLLRQLLRQQALLLAPRGGLRRRRRDGVQVLLRDLLAQRSPELRLLVRQLAQPLGCLSLLLFHVATLVEVRLRLDPRVVPLHLHPLQRLGGLGEPLAER